MKVLIDMNLSPGLAAVINRAGHEAVHWSTVGDPSATDHEIMAFARANDYIVLTNDLDFGAILAATQGVKPSVVQVRADDCALLPSGKLLSTPSGKRRSSFMAELWSHWTLVGHEFVFCRFHRAPSSQHAQPATSPVAGFFMRG